MGAMWGSGWCPLAMLCLGVGHAVGRKATIEVNFDRLEASNPRDTFMLKTTEPQRKKPNRKSVLRSVASSTAVETGQNVVQLERQLRQPSQRFAAIKLAR